MKISFLTFAYLLWVGAHADPGPAGARVGALSGAGLSFTDVWAVSNNIAGIAQLKKTALGAFAENRFNLKAFMTVGFQAAVPLKPGLVLGGEFSRFGDQVYHEQQVGLGVAHQLGPVRLGLKASLWQIHLEDMGSKRSLAFSFGGQSQVLPQLMFAAHIFNLNQARLAAFQDERLPTVMTAGLCYQPATALLLVLQAEKHILLPLELKTGLEYTLAERLALRAGLCPSRRTLSGGAGWKAKALQVDYAFGGHQALGGRNQVSVAYQFP